MRLRNQEQDREMYPHYIRFMLKKMGKNSSLEWALEDPEFVEAAFLFGSMTFWNPEALPHFIKQVFNDGGVKISDRVTRLRMLEVARLFKQEIQKLLFLLHIIANRRAESPEGKEGAR